MRRTVTIGVGAVALAVAAAAVVLIRDAPLDGYTPAPRGTLTFAEHVAPLVHANCAPCHRPGEAAPFPLLTYDDVHKHAHQIVEVTRSRFMPPWLPEPTDWPFAGERRLSVQEIGTIAQWVEEGAVRGDPTLEPAVPEFPEGWWLGEPDVVLELTEPYELTPDGPDVYRNFVFSVPVDRPRWVRAVEFRPNRARALHHATILVDSTPESRWYDARDPEPGFDGMINLSAHLPDGHQLGWVPGKVPSPVPDEIAWRLDPGTDLVVQLHIQPSGRPDTIAPRMGLSFTDRPAERRPYQVRLGARTLDIPAGAQSYAATDSYVLPVDVDVLGLLPHTHYLGKTIHLTATRPDGTTDKLLSIPDWDFNWQDEYRFAERVPLPAGTTLAVRFSWDNSAANVRNPHDPPRRVVFGPRATDEMGDLWIQVLTADESARAVLDEDFSRKEARATLAMYEKMVERDPDDVDVQYEFATVLLVQGRTDEAVDRLGRVLALEPDHAPAHGALGRILFDAGRSAEALSQFDRAIAGLPDVAELHYNRGQSLRALGRTDEALAAYDAALERDESLAAAWLATGDLLLAEGRADEAVGRYRRAIEADPSYAEAHNNLGTVLAARGRLDEAIEQFRQAVEASPTYAPAYNNLGMALAAQGRLDDAVAALSTAVRLRPDHAGSRQNLARALALRERRGEATTR